MELLVHINKRIKNNNNIQLPMEALLLQYQVRQENPFNQNLKLKGIIFFSLFWFSLENLWSLKKLTCLDLIRKRAWKCNFPSF